jgi:hypothetical protein
MNTSGFDFDCDFRFGFNFDPPKHGTVGYLLFWSGCGGLSLQKDIEIWNPFAGTGQTIVSGPTITCVGVIHEFRFDGESDAPIRMVAYVSKATAANIRNRLASPVTSTTLQVAWYIISYDDERKQWYEAAFIKGGAKASANIDVVDGVLQLAIDPKPTRLNEQLDILVYRMEFQIVPAEGSSATLEFAAGPTQRLVKSWAES